MLHWAMTRTVACFHCKELNTKLHTTPVHPPSRKHAPTGSRPDTQRAPARLPPRDCGGLRRGGERYGRDIRTPETGASGPGRSGLAGGRRRLLTERAAVGDAPLAEVVGRQGHRDRVSRQDADEVLAHFP